MTGVSGDGGGVVLVGGVVLIECGSKSPIGVGDDGLMGCGFCRGWGVFGRGWGEFWRVEATPVVFRGCFG